MVLALVLLLTACSVAPASVPPALLPDPAVRIGIAYGNTLIAMSDQQLASTMDDAVALGVQVIRSDLDWDDVQPTSPTEFRWERFDRVVEAVARRNLTLLPVVAYTPPWARGEGCVDHKCAPADASQFAAFAGAAASRYADRGVVAWEIWNEPNDSGFWSPQADPRGYYSLLEAASRSIRAVDPSAPVLLGGLAAIRTKGKGLSPADFLRQVCSSGDLSVVDGVAFHPYTYPGLPSEASPGRSTAWNLIDQGADSLRAVLNQTCRTPGLPIWLTEYGAPTGGPGEPSDGSPGSITEETTHVTEQRQAAIATDVLKTVRIKANVEAMIWYADQDLGDDASSNLDFYGLRRADGSKKPAFDAFAKATRTYGFATGG